MVEGDEAISGGATILSIVQSKDAVDSGSCKCGQAITQGTAGVPATARSQRAAVVHNISRLNRGPLRKRLKGGVPVAHCVRILNSLLFWC